MLRDVGVGELLRFRHGVVRGRCGLWLLLIGGGNSQTAYSSGRLLKTEELGFGVVVGETLDTSTGE